MLLPVQSEDQFNPQDSPDNLQETCEVFMQEVQEISSNIRKVANEASVVNQFKLNQ